MMGWLCEGLFFDFQINLDGLAVLCGPGVRPRYVVDYYGLQFQE